MNFKKTLFVVNILKIIIVYECIKLTIIIKSFQKNLKELNKRFQNKNNNFKIDSIKLLINYFEKLK